MAVGHTKGEAGGVTQHHGKAKSKFSILQGQAINTSTGSAEEHQPPPSSTACSPGQELHEGFSLPKRPMTAGNVTLPTQKGNTEIHPYFP